MILKQIIFVGKLFVGLIYSLNISSLLPNKFSQIRQFPPEKHAGKISCFVNTPFQGKPKRHMHMYN